MKFRTYTGSVYEVDQQGKRIRRLTGKNEPTSRQGKDNEWRDYRELILTVGKSAWIFWDPKTTPLLDGNVDENACPTTVTSEVIEIIHNDLGVN